MSKDEMVLNWNVYNKALLSLFACLTCMRNSVYSNIIVVNKCTNCASTSLLFTIMNCEHVLASGHRRGKQCQKQTWKDHVPFCDSHVDAHKAEWEPIVKEAGIKRRREEEEFKIARNAEIRKARVPNADSICRIDRYRSKLAPSIRGVKTEDTIEECVTAILTEITKSLFRFADSANGLSNMYLHPFDYRGWPAEEIAAELENRLYTCHVKEDCIIFKARYIPDFY